MHAARPRPPTANHRTRPPTMAARGAWQATGAAPDLRWPGGHSEGATPDPIPNSVVKTLSADGTASQGVEE